MKHIFLITLMTFISHLSNAQFKKNGDLDMRFKANRSSSSYSAPVYKNSGYQSSYTKSNGTYVDGSYHTPKNNTNIDNYSTKGNTNLYSGKRGSRAQDYSIEAQDYGAGREIHRGFFGGRYYIDDNGKKVYVPKQ
jgi:hypothetical protein